MYPSQWQRRCWRYLCYELGGPPLISISSNFFQRIPTGRPTWDSRHGGHGGSSPYFTFLISPKRTARTGGPPLISILIPIQTRSNLHGRRVRNRGASPYFSTVPVHSHRPRCRHPLQETGQDPHWCPLLAPVSEGPRGVPRRIRSPAQDAPVQEQSECKGAGGGQRTSPGAGWATGRPGEPTQTATPRWSPPCAIVAPPRWPARGGARDLATQPPWLDWVAPQIACWPRGTPPWFHPHTTVRSRAPGRPWGSGGLGKVNKVLEFLS